MSDLTILAQTPTPSSTALEEVLDVELPTAGDPCPNDTLVCEWILDQTGSEFLAGTFGEIVPVLVVALLIILGTAIVGRVAKGVATRLVRRTARRSSDAMRSFTGRGEDREGQDRQATVLAERREQRTTTIAAVIGSLTLFFVWSIGILIALAQIGLNIGPLIAGAGIIGVALGFGAQSLVRDFVSGTFMLLEDQYGVGDVIDVGEAVGTVEAVTLRVTRLRDIEGTVWHVPNGVITRVGNLSQLWSRSLLDIGVAYDTDLEHASEVITRVAHDLASDPDWDPEILDEPELWGVEQFGPNEIVLRLVIKTRPAAQWKVNREFRRRLKAAFDAEGIEIPFPQRTIWVKEGQAAGVPTAALAPPPTGQDDADPSPEVG